MGDPVGGTTGVAYEVVAKRVSVLRDLVNEFLDDIHPVLLSTRDRQDATRWTDLAECAGFRAQYLASIDIADIALRAVWDDIVGLARNLQAAAASMSDLDQAVGDDLTALLARIQAEHPTGYSGFTPSGVPVEIYSNMTGGYASGSGNVATGDVDEVGQDGV